MKIAPENDVLSWLNGDFPERVKVEILEPQPASFTAPPTIKPAERDEVFDPVQSNVEYIPKEDGVFWPPEKIVDYLAKTLKQEDCEAILSCESETDLYSFHHNAGRWIRNTFKLWLNDNPHTEYQHPDEVSHQIIVSIWKQLKFREAIGL